MASSFEDLRFDKEDAKAWGRSIVNGVMDTSWNEKVDSVVRFGKWHLEDGKQVLTDQFGKAVALSPTLDRWELTTDTQRFVVILLLALFVALSLGASTYTIFNTMTHDIYYATPDATLIKTAYASEFEADKKKANQQVLSVSTPYTLYTPLSCLYIASEAVLPAIDRPDAYVYRRSTVTSQRMMNRLVDPESMMDSRNLTHTKMLSNPMYGRLLVVLLIIMTLPLWIHRREYFVGALIGTILMFMTMTLLTI